MLFCPPAIRLLCLSLSDRNVVSFVFVYTMIPSLLALEHLHSCSYAPSPSWLRPPSVCSPCGLSSASRYACPLRVTARKWLPWCSFSWRSLWCHWFSLISFALRCSPPNATAHSTVMTSALPLLPHLPPGPSGELSTCFVSLWCYLLTCTALTPFS